MEIHLDAEEIETLVDNLSESASSAAIGVADRLRQAVRDDARRREVHYGEFCLVSETHRGSLSFNLYRTDPECCHQIEFRDNEVPQLLACLHEAEKEVSKKESNP